jgi:osmotically-inducible protein OsmY
MKKIVGVLILVALASCSGFVAKTNDAIEVSTRTYRTMTQISLDHKIDKVIGELIGKNRDYFSKNIANYDINTFNSIVLVTGVVNSGQDVDFILKKISEIPEVLNVINELVVDPEAPKNNSSDFFIKNSINSKIKVKKLIKTINYKISVINGRVFVIGIAENKRERETLLKSISTIRGVKEVISYVTLKNDIK